MLSPLEILLKDLDFKRVLEAKTRGKGPSISEVRKREEEAGLSNIIFASPTRNKGEKS